MTEKIGFKNTIHFSLMKNFPTEGGLALAETRTLLDYAGHHRPSEGGPAEPGSLSTSNLSLTLNTALTYICYQLCLYSVSRYHFAGRGKYFRTQEVPL